VFLVKLCSSMGRRLGVVVVVEIACTLSKCVTRWRSASCWIVAAEVGSVSETNGLAGATVAGSMLEGASPSLKEAQWTQLTLDMDSLFGDIHKMHNAVVQLRVSSSHWKPRWLLL